jgi:hypothetical protein
MTQAVQANVSIIPTHFGGWPHHQPRRDAAIEIGDQAASLTDIRMSLYSCGLAAIGLT